MQRNGLERAGLLDTLLDSWRALIGRLRNPYRPERHYMRGPGPRWRAANPTETGRSRDEAGRGR